MAEGELECLVAFILVFTQIIEIIDNIRWLWLGFVHLMYLLHGNPFRELGGPLLFPPRTDSTFSIQFSFGEFAEYIISFHNNGIYRVVLQSSATKSVAVAHSKNNGRHDRLKQ
jgi:hypothetical protein